MLASPLEVAPRLTELTPLVPMIYAIIQSIRPKQWTKNLFLFAGWLFSISDRTFVFTNEVFLFIKALYGFALFCMLSSAVYLINDIMDVEADRQHPDKKNRPIASGALPVPAALTAAIVLLLAGTSLSFMLSPAFGLIALIYFTVFALYTLALKRILILDTMIIALGFVLRAVAGAVAVGEEISAWLVVCTVFLALFLGFGKRRSELVTLGDVAASHRGILAHYSVRLLELLLGICGTLSIIAYSLYTISPRAMQSFGADFLLTLPFVFFGMFRYLYIVVQEDRGGDPAAVLLSDPPLLINAVLWILASALILIFKPGLLNRILVH